MRALFIPLLFFVFLILAVVLGASSSSDDSEPDSDSVNPPLPLTPKHDAVIAVAPDGTVYYVDSVSGKILWSFSSGQSIYSSYQQIPNHEGERFNASGDGDGFYIDCGEDWELYLHTTGLKRVKLPLSADEFVKRTPFVSTGGGVILGSKKTAVYLVDAKTGKVVQTFRSDNFPSVGEREASSLTKTDIEKWLPPSPVNSNSKVIEEPLYVTRTDYALKYTSAKTGKVLWYLMFADIDASYQCEGIENFWGGFTPNGKFQPGEGLGMKLPMHCKTRPVVYRIRDRSSLVPLFLANKMNDALSGSEILSLPAPDHHAIEPSSPLSYLDRDAIVPLDSILAPHKYHDTMLALPTFDHEEFLIRSLPGTRDDQTNSRAESNSLVQSRFWLYVLYSALVAVVVSFFIFLRGGHVQRRGKDVKLSEGLKLQNVTPKKRKPRKSVVSKQNMAVGKKHDDSPQNGAFVTSEALKGIGTTDRFFPLDQSDGTCTDGRKIGKLVVSNKEIAKGSNGTIVLEGYYDGRNVAVKRLVRSHHSVAVKEIQNLIASDQHPNIVRWYGVEFDQDFVYICLERCKCNLHVLILACSCNNRITNAGQDHESLTLTDYNIQLLRSFGSNKELELWKSNGYPSAWLLKLMRDTVCGVAHLHELGIIHRDLKPQNVLVIKDRSISAKISDMGISKHLDGEMSSLTKNTTGTGSSGWQAPEQLRHQRQTRAVDLFSLGCILFFCMTGGKHPYGENLERDLNIVNDRKDLFLIDGITEATDLIFRLLDPNPDMRPKAIEVMHHPLFWSSETRLSFLRDVSDRVELEHREDASELLEALESIGKVAFGGKWDEHMDNTFINDIGRYRRYRFDSVRDLLRVIRNKLNHYRELSKDIQAILGPLPEGFDSYFSTRFPKLLIEVYWVIAKHCAAEETFQKYFNSTRL